MVYTDKELLEMLVDYHNKYGFPKQREFSKKKGYPSHVTYHMRFGNFQNAIKLAGIEIPSDMKKLMNRKNKYSKKDILEELVRIVEEYQQENIGLPPYTYVEDNSNIVSESMIYSKFGNLKNAYKLMGFDEDYNDNAIKEDMIDKYLQISNIIGKPPTSRDIDSFSRNGDGEYYAMTTYINRFGNLNEIEKLLNVEGNCKTRYMTKEDIVKWLMVLHEEIGDIPTQQDINECKYIPSIHKTLRILGYKSITQLQKELFGKCYSKIKITEKGTVCLSQYEYIFARVLEKYKYNFKKDKPYRDYGVNIENRLTVDFVINHDGKVYFVEIFGITGVDSYDIKTEQKIGMCKNANIPLLALYPNDFYNMNQEKWNDKIQSFLK